MKKNLQKNFWRGVVFGFFFLFSFFSAGKAGETVFVALSSQPTNLNPLFSTDSNSQNLNRLIHTNLIDVGPDMEMVCRLCQTFTQKMVGGAHHLHFTLRKDVKFWDGTAVTAGDVENSVRLFTSEDPSLQSLFRFAFSTIKKVVVLGPHEVELIYEKFDLENISNLPLLKIIKMKGKDIVGAGPYRLDEASELSFLLHPVFDSGLPTLIFKVVKDETTLALKLVNKEIDLSLAELSPRKHHYLREKKIPFLQTWMSPGTNVTYIGINHKREMLKDLRVRKALGMLIPREDLLTYKLRGMATPATSLLSPAFKGKGYASPLGPYDPVTARKLLEEAHFPLDKEGKRFSLNWRLSNNKATVEMAQTVAQYFEKEGIRINLIIQEWGTFYRGFKNGEYDLASASWVGLAGPEMLRAAFHSENFAPKGNNRGFFVNKEFETWVDLATHETDELKRNELYRKAQAVVNADYPYLYLWHPHIVWVGRNCLQLPLPYPNGSFLPLLEMKSSCGRKEKERH